MDVSEDVDFDFFDTPRDDNIVTQKVKEKPTGLASSYKQKKHGDLSDGKQSIKGNISEEEEEKYEYSDDTFSSTESESENPRYERSSSKKKSELKKKPQTNKRRKDSTSESSSAYSNSDYSSDDSEQDVKDRKTINKEVIDVHIPKAHVEAWSEGSSNTKKHNDTKQNRYVEEKRRNHQKKAMSESSDSEIDDEKGIYESRNSSTLKNGKAKSKNYRTRGNGRKKPLRSSSSYSNNSDITDVSPLESPQASPRYSRKSTYDKEGKENGKNVQYSDSNSPERTTSQSINLESDEIDLSILMKCMADIDREKQERLKTNSRRVMFAQPATSSDRKIKGNYTFSMGQAKLIEKENQRLLKQIMNQMNSNVGKKAPGSAPRPRGPKKAVAPGPAFQRLTPSAVNRMREQRRIEQENMQMLSRLQTVRPSKGMARAEQIDEAERQMSYGVPCGTSIIQGQSSHYDTMSNRYLHSSMGYTAGSTQRSRPSSAKSNASVSLTPGKRSRPSSAKSNASMRSNASVMSNVSKMSTASVRSNAGVRRMADGRHDKRPEWNDRFSFS